MNTFIIGEYEGETYVEAFEEIDANRFFKKISKYEAFSDITMEHITKIYYKGHEVKYAGWQPNMRFEYKDLNGNTIWAKEFPEWDH